jgi:hypothetical protein
MSQLLQAFRAITTHCRLSRLILAASLGLTLASAATSASADTLVYVKAGQVQVARADGSQGRPVSPRGTWAWPSESDNGTIAALSIPDYEISEFDQQGRSLLSSPMVTPASTYNSSANYYVDHVRISPNGGTVAYNVDNCCGFSGRSTFLQPAAAGSSNGSDFTDDYVNPVWVDASAADDPYVAAQDGLGLGHNGYNWAADAAGGCCQYGIWNAGNPSDNGGWPSDSAIPSSDWEFEVAYTRNLKHLALFLDDSPAYTGVAHNVKIVLESVDWADKAATTDDCTIPLQASSYRQVPQNIDSLSYSSDGSTLAWADDAGIHEANVANPSNCAAVRSSVHLVVPGGAYPYFGAAALSAKRTTPAAAPNTRITKATVSHRARTATFRWVGSGGVGRLTFRCRLDRRRWSKCGTTITYRRLRHGRHTFSVRAIDSRGTVDPTPASRRFTF